MAHDISKLSVSSLPIFSVSKSPKMGRLPEKAPQKEVGEMPTLQLWSFFPNQDAIVA